MARPYYNEKTGRPLGSFVTVRLEELPDKTEGGIILSDAAKQGTECLGTVLHVGRGQEGANGIIPNEVQPGDKVIVRYGLWANLEDMPADVKIVQSRNVMLIVKKGK